MITLLLTIIVHELGHLVGGLLTHYRFTMIEVLGVVLYRCGGRLRLRLERRLPLGQCLMHAPSLSANPGMLILGGCIANLFVGVGLLAAGMLVREFLLMLLLIYAGGINILAGIANIIPESATSDGATYRDAASDPVRAQIYNRLMEVYMHLENGEGYAGLPEDILAAPTLYDSTLAAELAVYRYYRLRDLSARDATLREEAKLMLLDLARYRPETGIGEVLHGL